MGLIARQSFKAATVTYIGVALGVVNSLYIYTKMLSVEQLGELTFMHTSVAILAPLVLFGFGSVLVKFYPQVKDSERNRNALFTLVFGVVLLNVILFASTVLFFREEFFSWFTDEESFLLATSFAIVGMACMQTFIYLSNSIASIQGLIAVPSMLVQIIKLVQPGLVILYYFSVIDFEAIIYGLLIYYVFLAGVYLLYAYRLSAFSLSFCFSTLPFSLRSVLIFALFSILGTVGGLLTNQVDILMITNMLGKYQTGLYGWSLFFITVIAIPYNLVGTVSTPLISQYWKDSNLAELNKLYKQSSSSLLVISFGLFACLLAGIDELFVLMPKGDEYKLAKTLIVFLCLAKIIDMASGLNNQIVAMSSSYRYLLLFLLIAVVSNIGFNLLLIPVYGIEGSAYATVISISLYNLIKFLFLKKRYQLQPFSLKTLQILVVGVVVIGAVYLMPRTDSPVLNILFFCSITFIVYFGAMYKWKMAPELNSFVNKQLKRFGLSAFN